MCLAFSDEILPVQIKILISQVTAEVISVSIFLGAA
jgi:hypothetical protein